MTLPDDFLCGFSSAAVPPAIAGWEPAKGIDRVVSWQTGCGQPWVQAAGVQAACQHLSCGWAPGSHPAGRPQWVHATRCWSPGCWEHAGAGLLPLGPRQGVGTKARRGRRSIILSKGKEKPTEGPQLLRVPRGTKRSGYFSVSSVHTCRDVITGHIKSVPEREVGFKTVRLV